MSGYAFLMFGDFIFSLLIFRPSCFYIILWLWGNIKLFFFKRKKWITIVVVQDEAE